MKKISYNIIHFGTINLFIYDGDGIGSYNRYDIKNV